MPKAGRPAPGQHTQVLPTEAISRSRLNGRKRIRRPQRKTNCRQKARGQSRTPQAKFEGTKGEARRTRDAELRGQKPDRASRVEAPGSSSPRYGSSHHGTQHSTRRPLRRAFAAGSVGAGHHEVRPDDRAIARQAHRPSGSRGESRGPDEVRCASSSARQLCTVRPGSELELEGDDGRSS